MKIGNSQTKEFQDIKHYLSKIENENVVINNNLQVLNQKLDFIISILEKNSR